MKNTMQIVITTCYEKKNNNKQINCNKINHNISNLITHALNN